MMKKKWNFIYSQYSPLKCVLIKRADIKKLGSYWPQSMETQADWKPRQNLRSGKVVLRTWRKNRGKYEKSKNTSGKRN